MEAVAVSTWHARFVAQMRRTLEQGEAAGLDTADVDATTDRLDQLARAWDVSEEDVGRLRERSERVRAHDDAHDREH